MIYDVISYIKPYLILAVEIISSELKRRTTALELEGQPSAVKPGRRTFDYVVQGEQG